ncbi:OLC1v1028760C1 [Oldenlandia corymbosa var. corymbosa]|uniref:OLC1v1028760C1 n=1 Tax=Oldenlandia corymbosa var. corymbosa TaxID=529605 RepID=A0AAV1CD94_OLDCO|nr:OLC1v1028760C1 [Oldenlandia corymbosa var. corymbosa]
MTSQPTDFVPDGEGTIPQSSNPEQPPPLDNQSAKKPKYGGANGVSPTPLSFRDKILRGLDYSLFDVEDDPEIGDEDVILTKDGAKAKIMISDQMRSY